MWTYHFEYVHDNIGAFYSENNVILFNHHDDCILWFLYVHSDKEISALINSNIFVLVQSFSFICNLGNFVCNCNQEKIENNEFGHIFRATFKNNKTTYLFDLHTNDFAINILVDSLVWILQPLL